MDGKFFMIAADNGIYYPMMEMSCGRVFKIQGIHYLYNPSTGYNDGAKPGDLFRNTAVHIQGLPRMSCDKEF